MLEIDSSSKPDPLDKVFHRLRGARLMEFGEELSDAPSVLPAEGRR
jgi:hypothetical protein